MRIMLNRYLSTSRRKIVSFSLAFCILLSGAFQIIPNMGAYALGQSGQALGESDPSLGNSLGYSMISIGISSAQELYDISKRVNSGEFFADKRLIIQQEINLQELEEWEPIGTEEHPYQGEFDGQENLIRGFIHDDPVFSTLFGAMKGVTVKNTTIGVRCEVNLREVDSYLFEDAVQSTIENCQVVLDPYLPFMMASFATVTPDTSWYNTSDPSFTLTTEGQLLGLAKIVNNENPPLQDGFSGKEIVVSGNFDLGSILDWEPIGTAERPFEGTFRSASTTEIKNMTINTASTASAGLFGHIRGAKIENINVTDANVTGTDNVGILVGHATNSEIKNCYVTGIVVGISPVGGLIGYATHNLNTVNVAQWCYSTADVTGTTGVGGFIGQLNGNGRIQDCFSTGTTSGVVHVGGFAGEIFSSSKIERVATTGNVKGSGNVGGIAGVGPASGTTVIQNAYTASRVDAFSDSGAMLGSLGKVEYSYTSGTIYGVQTGRTSSSLPAYFVSSGTGYSGSAPNTVCNWDAVAYFPGDKNGNGPASNWFFPASGGAENMLQSTGQFTSNNITCSTAASGSDRIPDDGYYPQLNTFNSGPTAFQAFSQVSTNVPLTRIPDTLIYNNGKLANTSSVDVTLPSVGGIQWKFEGGGTTYSVNDLTVPEGKNTVRIVGSQLEIDYPAVSQFSMVLIGDVVSVPGLVIKKVVTVSDEAVRPLLSSLSDALYLTDNGDGTAADDGFPNLERLSKWEDTLFLEFPEPITAASNPIPSGTHLTMYDSTWSTPTATRTVNYTLLGDTVLKVDWTPQSNFVGYDERLELQIPASLGLTDEAGTPLDLTYYFMSVRGIITKLSFSPYVSGQVSLNADADEQTISMVMNDPNYDTVGGYLEGIIAENETAVVVSAADATFTVVQTVFNTPGFPPLGGDIAVDPTNFYKYPGTYRFSYQVPDPEDPSQLSNIIVRTYEVTDEVKDLFYANGTFGETYLDAYQPFIHLEASAVAGVLEKSPSTTTNGVKGELIAVIEEQLRSLHKATITDQSTGLEKSLAITYDFSDIPDTVFDDGYNKYIPYTIEGVSTVYYVYVQVDPALSMCEIVTKFNSYLAAPGEYNQQAALRYFDPSLQRIGSANTAVIPANWSLQGNVNTSQLDVAQTVTIQAERIYGIDGYTLKKDVIVTITSEDLVPEFMKDRKKREDTYFWERVEVGIRRGRSRQGCGSACNAAVCICAHQCLQSPGTERRRYPSSHSGERNPCGNSFRPCRSQWNAHRK